MRIRPDDFGGSSLGARFYPMLYLMTRTGQAVDWGSGIPLKKQLLGKNSSLEVHHIFPKKRLRDAGYVKKQVNAIANFCFLTKGTNLAISASDPAVYLAEIEERFPGALASQWVPTDPKLWHVDRYLDFLAERRVLLAAAANALMEDLLHGTPLDLGGATPAVAAASAADVPGGLGSEDEERELRELNAWVAAQGLHEGELEHELVDPQTGLALAVLDLAWPDGLQQGLGEPVAVLLDEPAEVLARASAAGYRCFVDVAEFRRYVEGAVGGEGDVAAE